LHEPISPLPRAYRDPSPRSKGYRSRVALFVVLVVILAGIIALDKWPTHEYALTPGDATPVAPLVKITGVESTTHHGKIMLTDVYLSSLNGWQWVIMHFESHVQFLPANELVDPGVPTNELEAQGFLEMSDSKQAAEVAAFHALGWKTPATPSGAVVNSVVAPSPAHSAGIKVADEITAVNGKNVTSACSLVGAMYAIPAGTTVRLTLKRAVISSTGIISYQPPSRVDLTTSKPPSGIGTSGCPGLTGVGTSYLGVAIEDGNSYRLPARVSINTANIGGPSAGLAMTLTLIDKLSRESISGNQPIAATGTIDASGDVGDVGGVAEKTVAVARAGAKYFFVPQVEVARAKADHEPGLKIIGVTTLAEALRDLRALGGAAPQALTPPH
jgi:PDZ domain-containing protein